MKKLLIATSLMAIVMMESCNNEAPSTMIGRQTPEVKNGQFTPELLWAMGRVGSYDASNDGKTVAYNVSYYSVEENKSHTVIYTINTDGTNEKLLTTAVTSESAPKYLNEGKQITFLAPDKDGVSQIWVMNADGSGRKQLSKCEKDVDDYLFSPDGKKAIVIHQVPFHNIIHERPEDLPKSTGLVCSVIGIIMWRAFHIHSCSTSKAVKSSTYSKMKTSNVRWNPSEVSSSWLGVLTANSSHSLAVVRWVWLMLSVLTQISSSTT